MEKKTIITLIGGLTLSLAAVVAGTLSYNLLKQDTSITNGDNTSYTLKIDKENGGVISGSYVATPTDYKVKTTLGNELTLQYVNGMTPGSTASSNCIIQVKKSAGYIYNSSAISNITSISVSYTSSAKPTLTYGDVAKPTSNSQTIDKNTAINITTTGVNYFKLAAGANALYLESITITYSCTPQIPTVTGITATDANETYNIGDIYKTSNALTVVANISNGTTETLEYDATGENGYALYATNPAESSFDLGNAFPTVGVYKITASYSGFTSTIDMPVKDPENPTKVESVTLDKTSEDLVIGSTLQLTATITPAWADNKTLTWASTNSAAASVSQSGLVTGNATGTTTISATTQDGSAKSASCTITVAEAPTNYYKASEYTGTVNYTNIAKNQGCNGLPTKGTIKTLVIPVEVSGYTFTSSILSDIALAFNGNGKSDTGYWESVSSFYNKSSYGDLDLQYTISDKWSCGYTPTQIDALSQGDNSDYPEGTQKLLEYAIAWYKTQNGNNSVKQFDNDGDGYIDGVTMIYSCPNYSNKSTLSDTFWAYTYWDWALSANTTTPNVNCYQWASYDFMYEGGGSSVVDAHTYIHETGHMLGLDDYYNYDSNSNAAPLGGIAMQDYNVTDQDIWSKMAFGWVEPYVVTGSCTITINPSQSSGDCIILTAGDWNGLAFDEMLIMELYTNTGLNQLDGTTSYCGSYPKGFTIPGIRMQHVDARLGKINGSSYGSYSTPTSLSTTVINSFSSYYAVFASNTPSYSYNSKIRLNQLIQAGGSNTLVTSGGSAKNADLFTTGTSFSMSSYASHFTYSSGKFNSGATLGYTISFTSVSATSATITFTKA